jgi:hypothetical protein
VNTREALLVHQVHAVKLGADIGASVVSLALIWRGHWRAGMVLGWSHGLLGRRYPHRRVG